MAISLAQHSALFTQALVATFEDDIQPQLGLSAWFPTVTRGTKYLSIAVRRHRQLVAVDVQRCTDPNRNLFSISNEKIFYPPFFSESTDVTACEGYDMTFGRGVGLNAEYAAIMVRDAADKMNAMKNKIERAIEKQRASVLQFGTVTMRFGTVINYSRKAESMPVFSGANMWSDPTAPIYQQIQTGIAFLRREGNTTQGATVDLLMGASALSNLMNNTALQNRAKFFNQINLVDIKMPQYNNKSGITLHGEIGVGDARVRLWTYDGYYENNDGTKTSYLDPDIAILLPSDFEGVTGFAGIPTVFNPNTANQYIAPKEGAFVTYDLIDPKKKTWDQVIESAPLVIPISVDRIYSMLTA